jgi:endonuclease III related protein
MNRLYRTLLKKHCIGGRRYTNWWPMSGNFRPKQFEVCVGAILTQNTNWRNVEKALESMAAAKKTSAKAIAVTPLPTLAKLIRPAGFYRQKSKSVRELARFIVNFDGDFYKKVTREQLLALRGIGPETADSILLYACGKPSFVIDAYTRRLLKRENLAGGDESYDTLKARFEKSLPRRVSLYKEFHALIVENEKKIRNSA